jgi:6-phosphofructokinase
MAETAIPRDGLACLGEEASANPEFRSLYEAVAERLTLSDAERTAIREYEKLRRTNKRLQGQASDALRTAGLRIVIEGLPILLRSDLVPSWNNWRPDWQSLRVFSNEPRYLLRATTPTTSDVITARRLGILAVDNAMAGYTNFMISQWLTEFVLVPLELVVLGRKRVPEGGIFWKSVRAKTGQGDIVAPWSGAAPPA